MRRFRPFQVRLPSGDRYWTVVDAAYRPVAEADEWLLHVRLGRDCAESTTEAYARSMALFLEWCAATGQDWRQTPGQFGRFVYWVQRYDPDAPAYARVRIVRGARRVNAVLAAVREFFKHAVAIGLVGKVVLDALFDLVEDYDLPAEVRGDRAGLRLRSRPRHRLAEPQRVVDAASDEDVLALLRVCRNARDRFIVLALWRIGHRRGELTGIRLEDVHFVPDATRLGCRIRGEHLHVRRRSNPNGATAKSRRSRAVPADWFVVQGYDQYMIERGACPQARRCDFLLVNLFREPLGRRCARKRSTSCWRACRGGRAWSAPFTRTSSGTRWRPTSPRRAGPWMRSVNCSVTPRSPPARCTCIPHPTGCVMPSTASSFPAPYPARRGDDRGGSPPPGAGGRGTGPARRGPAGSGAGAAAAGVPGRGLAGRRAGVRAAAGAPIAGAAQMRRG